MTASFSFHPVAATNARVLILGSLPGVESLRRQQYYAMPRNCFWFIMGELFAAGPDLPYTDRLDRLRQNRVALWDVCETATRPGSRDSNIVPDSIVANDFEAFFATHREISLVCLNGGTAARLYAKLVVPSLSAARASIEYRVLPSTSPAHATLRPPEKLQKWQEALSAGSNR